jgi:hypothetical protein
VLASPISVIKLESSAACLATITLVYGIAQTMLFDSIGASTEGTFQVNLIHKLSPVNNLFYRSRNEFNT